MNKKFLRDDFEYYLEIEAEGGEEYEYQMLVANRIDTILPVNIMTVDEKRQLIYSASGYKTLENCIEKMVINGEQIGKVMDCVLNGIDEVRRYLLAPNNLVLSVDCLFVEPDYSRVGLIYVPGYGRDIILQLRELMESLLGRIDGSDMKSVMLAWKLHILIKDEHISLKEIRKTMSCYKENDSMELEQEPAPEEQMEYKEIRRTAAGKKREVKRVTPDWIGQISIPQRISLIITLVLAAAIICMFILIYTGGILPWKRNLLLVLLLLFVISLGSTAALKKKDKIIHMLKNLKEK